MENKITYPITTREETADGWIVTTDYGPKQGKSTVRVHRAAQDDGARAELARFLESIGYTLVEG
jgi:hypothetical protein